MQTLPISVIIITKNAEETIEDCLSYVQRNNPAEIIVVDGNSSDRTVEIARRFTGKIYSDGGKGKSYARQLGAEQATQEYVAYVDSDVTLSEGSLATMLAEFQGSGCVAISARQLPGIDLSGYWQWAPWQYALYLRPRRHEEYLGTMCCLFKRETLLRQGFDPAAGGLDDTDLGFRLRKEGHRFSVSSAIVYHNHQEDFRSFVKYRFFLGQLIPIFLKKHGPWHARFWPPLVMVYRLALGLIKGKPALVPYFVVDGLVQTAGMIKGFLKLAKGARR